jgi:hypothetical protein
VHSGLLAGPNVNYADGGAVVAALATLTGVGGWVAEPTGLSPLVMTLGSDGQPTGVGATLWLRPDASCQPHSRAINLVSYISIHKSFNLNMITFYQHYDLWLGSLLTSSNSWERIRDTIETIKNIQKKLTPHQWDLLLDLTQLVLDVAGIIEPTPVCDTLSMSISILRGDMGGAVVSGLGIVPYMGDVAKLSRLPRYLSRAQELLRMSLHDRRLAETLEPVLRSLHSVLQNLLSYKLPNYIRDKLNILYKDISKVLDTLRFVKIELSPQEAQAMVDAWKRGMATRPIVDRQTGKVVGEITLDGTRVIRYPHIDKETPQLRWNLEDKETGKIIHIILK